MKKEQKLATMIVFTFIFFLVELVTGYITGSVALIADSFHMLSDVAALLIALVATRLSRSKDVGAEFSYGLQRAEVLGALINGITLLALSLTLIIEAVQRLINPEELMRPVVVLYVGLTGLVVNLVGMLLFHEHSHAHHSLMQPVLQTESPSDAVAVFNELEHPVELAEKVIRAAALMQQQQDNLTLDEFELQDGQNGHSHSHDDHSHSHSHSHDHHHDLNMHGVFLHILGDLLGSVAVVATALVVLYTSVSWKRYLDPVASLVITILIIFSTIPMVKSACYILLQRTPSSVSVEKLRQDILQIDGVLGVHELHVWQLSESKMIASVHVEVPNPSAVNDIRLLEERYMDLVQKVKRKLHVN